MVSIISEAEKNLSVCQVSECLLHISGATLCGVSLCTLTMISVDRPLAMVLGVRYRHRHSDTGTCSWNCYFFVGITVFYERVILPEGRNYSKIYFTLRYRQAQVSQQPGQSIPTRARVLKYKRSVSGSMWVYLALIVCDLQFAVTQIVKAIQGETQSIVLAEGGATCLVYLNSSINPAIYCWRMREVKQAVK